MIPPSLQAPSSAFLLLLALVPVDGDTSLRQQDGRPNILIAMSDDQSFPHASAYGSKFVDTPAVDRVAREGVLFTNAFVASPGCSPSRAAFLTGRYPWQIEEAGTHASLFPRKYVVFPDLLERAGYFVGYTGKGWGPGDWKESGRPRNPAGTHYNARTLDPPGEGISRTDYAPNFGDFLKQRSKDQPFSFWYGGHEPHRAFAEGSGRRAGKSLGDVEVPSFLPDVPEVRSDLLDYAAEIEWFDQHLGRMLELLEQAGELENTIVIVTSDNGMAFPRAKGNVYEHGIHVPLAIRWGARAPGGRVVEDPISLVDLSPTILEAAGIEHPGAFPLSGRSVLNLLVSSRQGVVDPSRDAVFAGRERHSSSRYNNLSYPQRAIRTPQYLYIRNFEPERWPAGAPRKYEKDGTLGPMHAAYHDIDRSPTLSYLVDHRANPFIRRHLHLAVERRPAEELYDIRKDPGCLRNLANESASDAVTASLRVQLVDYLTKTNDPRILGQGDIFETYGRYGQEMRTFPPPEWALPPNPRELSREGTPRHPRF